MVAGQARADRPPSPVERAGGGSERLIVVRLNPRRLWRWQVWMVEALAVLPDCRVELAFAAARAAPAGVALLLQLERVVFRLRGVQAADVVHPDTLRVPRASSMALPSLVIDLAGDNEDPYPGAVVLRPLYCGDVDDIGLISALLARGDIRIGFVGQPYEHRPAVDSPDVLTRALNTVFSALLRLCLQFAEQRRVSVPGPGAVGCKATRPALPLTAFVLRSVREKVSERLSDLCRGAPRWRVGWRRTTEANSLGRSLRLPASGYTVLPDDGRRYYADPFILAHDGGRTLFVEEYQFATRKGLISAAAISADGAIATPRPVLEIETHLSYPFVFHHAGSIWMVPETLSRGRVDLYRAVRIPDKWEYAATLVDGINACDVTLTRSDGLWWMFAATQAWQSSNRDTLCLYSAADLLGPWVPHPANPVLVDLTSTRPGGSMFENGGTLWRPAQDASFGYGSGLSLCKIETLTRDAYAQRTMSVIRPGPSWPGNGLHTVNFHNDLEVVDGLSTNKAQASQRLL